MTLLATDSDDAGVAELVRLADILNSEGWRFIKGRKLETDLLPVQRFTLVKPSLRIVVEKSGSACGMIFEIDGEPSIALNVEITPPRLKANAEDATALCEWASGICRTLAAAPRTTVPDAKRRMTAMGGLVAALVSMESGDGMTFISWNPPTDWSPSCFGDSFRFLPTPSRMSSHLKKIASCTGHVRNVEKPEYGSGIGHRISRLDVIIDLDVPPDAADMMRMIRELGITEEHLAPDDDPVHSEGEA